ncbi:MAG: 50S ribosomal protein L29 [Ktedonobacterales bacterium]
MSRLRDQRREIHTMDLTVAEQALAERRRTLFELRLQKERGEVKNNRQFPQLKKEIARLLQHIGELNDVAFLAETEGSEETEGGDVTESDEETEGASPVVTADED